MHRISACLPGLGTGHITGGPMVYLLAIDRPAAGDNAVRHAEPQTHFFAALVVRVLSGASYTLHLYLTDCISWYEARLAGIWVRIPRPEFSPVIFASVVSRTLTARSGRSLFHFCRWSTSLVERIVVRERDEHVLVVHLTGSPSCAFRPVEGSHTSFSLCRRTNRSFARSSHQRDCGDGSDPYDYT